MSYGYGDWRDGKLGDFVYWLLATDWPLPAIAIAFALLALWLR